MDDHCILMRDKRVCNDHYKYYRLALPLPDMTDAQWQAKWASSDRCIAIPKNL